MSTKALLCVSFGTSVESARVRTLDVVEDGLAARFADRRFYRAWTSATIAQKVRDAGLWRDTLPEAFDRMSEDGVDDVVVALTCMMRGHEARKAEGALSAWLAEDASRKARFAAPLLDTRDDCSVLAQALVQEFGWIPADEALLLMGHGSRKGPNEVYGMIQDMLQRERPLFFVGTVEGEPSFAEALAQIRASGVRSVHLAPLMMVAGEHALADMAGEGDDSWKNVLAAEGFQAHAIMRGLAEYASVRQIVYAHASDAREFQA